MRARRSNGDGRHFEAIVVSALFRGKHKVRSTSSSTQHSAIACVGNTRAVDEADSRHESGRAERPSGQLVLDGRVRLEGDVCSLRREERGAADPLRCAADE